MRKMIALLFILSVAAYAQDAPKLTEAETLTLKISTLEKQLAESQATIAALNQQLTVQQIYLNHGWKTDEVSLKMGTNGLPEAVAKPEAKK